MKVLNSKQKVRQSNFELLRIVAIFLVIVSHFNLYAFSSVKVPDLSSFNGTFFIMTIFSTGAIGNLIFMILTGFFVSQKSINYKRIIGLLLEMIFYSFAFLAVTIIIGKHNITESELRSSLLPFPFGNWFVVYYIIFMMFAPFLNKLIAHLSKREHFSLVIVSIIALSVMPIFVSVPSVSSFAMFFVGYILGSYIRKHVKTEFSLKFLLVSLFTLITAVIILTGIRYNEVIAKMAVPTIAQVGRFIINNNSVFVVLIALIVFLIFRRIKIKQSRLINVVGGSVLGVYLIHENIFGRGLIWRRFNGVNPFSMGIGHYLLLMFCSSIVILVICVVIDRLRIAVLGRLESIIAGRLYSMFVCQCNRIENRLGVGRVKAKK